MFLFAQYQSGQINRNLIHYYPMKESSGTTLKDYGSSPSNLLLSGSSVPTHTTGQYGKALTFDGTSSYAVIQNDINFSGDITVTAWIKRNVLNDYGTIISKNNAGGSTYDLDFYIAADGSLGLFMSGGGTIDYTSSLKITDLNWHFIGLTVTSSFASFFLDYSGADTNQSIGGTRANHTLETTIGNEIGYAPSFFGGSIDEVKIFNRSFFQSEMQVQMKSFN